MTRKTEEVLEGLYIAFCKFVYVNVVTPLFFFYSVRTARM